MQLVSKRTAMTAGSLTIGLWIGLGSGLGHAASPSERLCEASGGEFQRINGSVVCLVTVIDPVGNSERSGGQSQTRDTTTTDAGQGNLGNKATSTSTCAGPGNAKCS